MHTIEHLIGNFHIEVSETLEESQAMQRLKNRFPQKMVVIADQALRFLYAEDIAQSLHAELLFFQAKESSKSMRTVLKLQDALFQRQVGRDALIIAFGGGITTDLVGYLASTYLRGVELMFIPTSLLAMVDAAIGGKTGVNTAYGKNLIGTFYLPSQILISKHFLNSLPLKEMRNGWAEILKMGLVFDASLWEASLSVENARFLIERAIDLKRSIVDLDPFERSIRRILNFGHTIAHGLEAVSNFRLAHGEAVAIGCVVESYLSYLMGLLPKEQFLQIKERFSAFPLRLPKMYTEDLFLEKIGRDKKNKHGKLRFVLLEKIGKAASFQGDYCSEVPLELLTKALQWMRELFTETPSYDAI